ncbi:TetR/AcrR family transcriptional regulator [Streptomyces sp. NPDC048659]|uniref:TetR/AcrR family transcriptional regulator n=1 Tax=Streptomyces sp. NPDC048659 TaxID=3155489 RepID=UPI0034144072
MDPAPDYRERRTLRTRGELARVGLELFAAYGYDETSVDDIVAAVGVVERTFFRHFPAKEDIALAVQGDVDRAFLEALEARPVGEPPAGALRHAALASWGSFGAVLNGAVPVSLGLRALALVESTAGLLGVALLRSRETENAAARIVAEREGLDVDIDPRPRIVAAVYGGLIRSAVRVWGKGADRSPEGLREALEGCLVGVQAQSR